MKRIILTLLSQFSILILFAAEGMWLLPNIPDAVADSMESAGMEFDIDYVYSEAKPSLKDATVYLTSGYTGTIISDNGLLIAPYNAIKNNLPSELNVDSGFVSESKYKEVPLRNLSAWILQSTKDVTYNVTTHTQGLKSEDAIKQKVDSVSRVLCGQLVLPSWYRAMVSATSTGGYFLYVYKCYADIRLAYMPPSAIANNALQKDRHSADFVILRIYADRQNEPAPYDGSNQTFEAKNAAVISINKYEEDDAVMALGYPNNSNRQMLGDEIIERHITKPEAEIAAMQFIDTTGYKAMKDAIATMQKPIARLKASGIVDSKMKDEEAFTVWAANLDDFDKVLRYTNVIPKIKRKYGSRKHYVEEYEALNVILNNVECLNAAVLMLDQNDDNEEAVFERINRYFVGLDVAREQAMLGKVFDYIEANIDSAAISKLFDTEKSKKYKGNRAKYVADVMAKSILTDEKRFMKYLDKPSAEALKADPLISIAYNIDLARKYFYLLSTDDDKEIAYLTRLFKEGQGEANSNMSLAPDANYSLRMSYGKIAGYSPDDTHYVNSTSNLGGAFCYSYLAPKAGVDSLLQALYDSIPEAKTLNVTFLTDCDMTSGRTGYGVYDYNGELLGIVTSCNGEAENNGYVYDAEYQRLTVLDMAYVTFVLNHYAAATYIYDELNFGEVEKEVVIKEVETVESSSRGDVEAEQPDVIPSEAPSNVMPSEASASQDDTGDQITNEGESQNID